MLVAREEANESSCKAAAICVDVEVAKREGAIAMVEDAVRRIAVVDVVVEDVEVEVEVAAYEAAGA
jgi:hypothetical protein